MKVAQAPATESCTLLELLAGSFLDGAGTNAGLTAGVPRALWDEALLDPLREFLQRPSKRFRARLLELGFVLGGGAPGEHPRELPLLIESLHAGSLIVDDIEDGSDSRRERPALHHIYGLPLALNAGNWLYFWPQVILSRSRLADSARLLAHERLAECLMRCHEGQALDLAVRVDRLAQTEVSSVVRAIARLKTGSLIGLATALGAIAAGAEGIRIDAIAAFGHEVGIGLQMLDDLSGIVKVSRRHKAIEDLRLARATWIWAWLAEEVDVESHRQLRAQLGEVMAGTGADALVERIRFRLAAHGLQRARAQLEQAIGSLRAAVGGGGWEQGARDELGRLERAYVGA